MTRIPLLLEQVQFAFPIGKEVIFHRRQMIVTSWTLQVFLGGLQTYFIRLTDVETGDWIEVDPKLWEL